MRLPATPRRRRAALAIATAVLVVSYGLGLLGALADAASRPLAAIAAPVHALGSSVSRAARSFFGAAGADSAALAAAIEALRLENSRLRLLASENDALRSALDYRETATDLTVLARVISESSDDADATIVIDRGADDGISDGLAAVSGDGVLVGKTTKVGRKSAHIRLLADSRSRVAAGIQTAEGTLGVLEGSRGLSAAVRLIPQNASIAPGDSIVTSGIEPGIRRGIPIGTVAAVKKIEQEPFQTADVEQYRSAAHPLIVLVILSPTERTTDYVEIGR